MLKVFYSVKRKPPSNIEGGSVRCGSYLGGMVARIIYSGSDKPPRCACAASDQVNSGAKSIRRNMCAVNLISLRINATMRASARNRINGRHRSRHRKTKKSELREIQNEIQRHNLDTFMSAEHKIVQTGCSRCQKHFGTVEQFKRHLAEDVLPPLLDRLSKETI
jgi:hypothetical protein